MGIWLLEGVTSFKIYDCNTMDFLRFCSFNGKILVGFKAQIKFVFQIYALTIFAEEFTLNHAYFKTHNETTS